MSLHTGIGENGKRTNFSFRFNHKRQDTTSNDETLDSNDYLYLSNDILIKNIFSHSMPSNITLQCHCYRQRIYMFWNLVVGSFNKKPFDFRRQTMISVLIST